MKRSASFSSLALLALPFVAFACAEPDPTTTSSSEAAISDSKVKLPANDECRDVLAPLALGLAESAVGLRYAKSITVSLTSETDTRLYAVSAVADGYTASFEVELDNDSASMCWLLSATNKSTTLANDAKTKLKHGEGALAAPVTVEPSDDDCADAVTFLADAAGVATVGKSALVGTSVKFLGEDENRYYRVHVDGRPFTVNGQTFTNDYDFDLETSNDSASKCAVQDFHPTRR
jgi:hypothetical protein